MAEPVRLVPQEGGAIGFLSRGEAEACYHARPAGVPLRPDGTPGLAVVGVPGGLRVRATRLVPGRAEPIHQSIPEQLDLDEAI